MLCPSCHSSNPENNRFCGNCGSELMPKDTPRRRRTDELPKELIEFDKKIPLIAEPGTDRRNRVPPEIREHVRDVVERDRLRAADRQREIEQKLYPPKPPAPPVVEEERPVQLPSGFLGLNTVETPRESNRVAPIVEQSMVAVPVETPVETQRVRARGSNNGFLNLEDEPHTMVETGVSGPSFLGLSDEYDLEQDEPESHTRRNVALIVLLLLIGLGATQWRAIRDQGLPFVKNGTQQIMLKVKGKQAQPPAGDSTNASSTGEPKIEVAPTNDNLKKAEPATNNAAANATPPNPAGSTSSDANNSAAATQAATAANSPSTTGGAAGAVTGATDSTDSKEAAGTAKPDSTSSKTANAKGKGDADGANSASGDSASENGDAATPEAKETTKKVADNAARKGRKPSGADRPQITSEESQAGSAELAQATAASDPGVQRQLLWSAVKKGNSEASVRLAELYIYGRGVEKSCDQAMVLLRSASAHNSARARGKLGAMYATGECVEQDRVQAYHWMSMALQANPNSDWTARYRDSIWNQMTSAEKMRAGRDR